MKNTFASSIIIVALSAAGISQSSGQSKPAAAAPDAAAPDNPVARGKGFVIKRSRLDEAVNSYQANATSRGHEVPPDKLPTIEAQLLDRLIESAILNPRPTAAQKAQGEEDGNKRFQMVKQHAPSEADLVRQLKMINLTLDLLRSRLIEEATFEAVLRSRFSIGDAQIKQYYETHPGDFEQPEMVRASHILLTTVDLKAGTPLPDDQKAAKRKEIEALLKRARAGEDFAKLAKQYSEDPGAKETGGEYTFPRGRMVAEFEAAAFGMKPNQISEVVTTQFGYHIIKLSEKIPAHKLPLEEVKAKLKSYLEQVELEKLMPNDETVPKFFQDLKQEYAVEILDPRLKAVEAKLGVAEPGQSGAK
jgi:peptidyl-prolyl cis-trans isomerase C